MLRTHFQWIFILLALVLNVASASSSDEIVTIAGYSEDEALMYGEQIYRDGLLPSGKPIQATVMGDIPVDGRMFTCDDCHQRSGLGSLEGTVITWPTNGKELYQPRRRTGAYRPPTGVGRQESGRGTLPKYYQMEDVRPAYTDTSLAWLLRSGMDSAKRKLDPIMPKFHLNTKDMDILVHYLKNLSVELSPGVDKTTLHFATVVTADVPEREKQAMLSVLQAHIDAHNTQTRHQERRAASGPFYKTEKHQAYRRLDLTIWELQGVEESWRDQLERYYTNQPVFALLGGISTGNWQPIHSFSEDHKIPCLFPLTDLPVISDSDWYTLYFSKGYYQEGESAAKYVRSVMGMGNTEKLSIVQIFRKNKQGIALAEGFRKTWESMGGMSPGEVILQTDSSGNEQLFHEQTGLAGASVLLLWLDKEDAGLLPGFVEQVKQKTMIFMSATLLEHDFSSITDKLRDAIHITYPYSLPAEVEKGGFAVKRWLQARKIPVTNFTSQAKMYFVGWMLPGALKKTRSEFYRDYFVENFDMMTDQDYAIAVYPRLTFGPGQRYASKGCYIVKLNKGSNPALLPVNDWVTY